MECILIKIQSVGKCETPFNLRLDTHRKDVNNSKEIPACCHFKIFTLIEQLTEISNVMRETLKLQLKRQGDFWIIKLNNV